jgi:hypothetical protein
MRKVMRKLLALWRGDLPLDEAFWTWAIIVGLAVNLSSSGAFLALMVADRPWAALAVGYGPSVPYNVLAVVGVWRAAARYRGEAAHAMMARVVTVALMLVLTVT